LIEEIMVNGLLSAASNANHLVGSGIRIELLEAKLG